MHWARVSPFVFVPACDAKQLVLSLDSMWLDISLSTPIEIDFTIVYCVLFGSVQITQCFKARDCCMCLTNFYCKKLSINMPLYFWFSQYPLQTKFSDAGLFGQMECIFKFLVITKQPHKKVMQINTSTKKCMSVCCSSHILWPSAQSRFEILTIVMMFMALKNYHSSVLTCDCSSFVFPVCPFSRLICYLEWFVA